MINAATANTFTMASLFSSSREERKNRRLSLLLTVLVHAILFVLFYFFFTYSPPNPPLPDYGVQLNFGIDEAGYGDVQSVAPANDNSNDANIGDPSPEPTPEPQITTPQPETAQAEPDAPKEVITTTAESPASVPDKPVKEIKKEERKVEEVKTTPQPPANMAKAPVEVPKVADGGRGKSGNGSQMAGNNNGDKPGKIGDQGSREGNLDSRNLYGTPGNGGGGTGASLEMAGWIWDNPPKDKDNSNEEGKIVFQIKVDESGQLTSVRVVEKTVSPKVVQFYQNLVENLEFNKTSDNKSTAMESVGRITIVIKSR